MKREILVLSLLLSFSVCQSQNIIFNDNEFFIGKERFDLNADLQNKGDSILSYNRFRDSFDQKFKTRRRRKSDYYRGILKNGIYLNLGPYDKRSNRNPRVLSLNIDFETYTDSILFLGILMSSHVKFDEVLEKFESDIIESSLSVDSTAKGYIVISRGFYDISFSFGKDESINHLRIAWYDRRETQ